MKLIQGLGFFNALFFSGATRAPGLHFLVERIREQGHMVLALILRGLERSIHAPRNRF